MSNLADDAAQAAGQGVGDISNDVNKADQDVSNAPQDAERGVDNAARDVGNAEGDAQQFDQGADNSYDQGKNQG
ncbi:hypothetical protein OE88DRAFT_1660487 [Heliocybe sulcata]|uniref:Uncharacterized protein n=1 Tax=Heliocybe sulcata TaxID=5364 RepID=A0A5C3N0K8_9AGAM|nr:hypothetical protein OE88DRAFT_1660487 [Heliocybe sulcata]